MDARYERNIPALSEEQCMLLRSKKIAVIGCGGLGGYLIEYLSRIGVGTIRAVDGDAFEPSNLNRQLLAEVPMLGISKAKAAADRIVRVNPDITVEAEACFLTAENASSLVAGCDAVLDALDNIQSRKLLAAACEKANIPYIYGAISGWVAQAAICRPGDGLIEKLYPADVALMDKSVLSFTPALCAAMQASLCVRFLAGIPVETGKLHYFDLLYEEYEQIPMK